LRGRDPKEISLKNLANIIQSRMEEILEHVYFEIKNSGLEKQLSGGIVLTGGGAQLKHLRQLTEYVTGMSTRIGYPNEHLANSKVEAVTSPLFATGVGLVLRGFDYLDRQQNKLSGLEPKVKSHSTSRVGNFFSAVISGASDIFRDDEA
ncbi:MAG TPA: cell division protein FtsA, partial [Flavobacteriales bacterium]|nr:cell division protein FtsA [Flavobacteriales bacterium]